MYKTVLYVKRKPATKEEKNVEKKMLCNIFYNSMCGVIKGFCVDRKNHTIVQPLYHAFHSSSFLQLNLFYASKFNYTYICDAVNTATKFVWTRTKQKKKKRIYLK